MKCGALKFGHSLSVVWYTCIYFLFFIMYHLESSKCLLFDSCVGNHLAGQYLVGKPGRNVLRCVYVTNNLFSV
jgi:hypothetical protein